MPADLNKIYRSTAVEKNNTLYHFGIHSKTAMLWGNTPDQIVDVEFKISRDQKREDRKGEVDYWGWYDEKEGKFSVTMIFPSYLQLFICFPFGIDKAEEAGQGMAYRLDIISIKSGAKKKIEESQRKKIKSVLHESLRRVSK